MQDPFCGMEVKPEKAAATAQWQGETYYFCSPRCQEKFVADPEGVLRKRKEREEASAVEPQGREFTCPMHPEVIQDRPGSPCVSIVVASK